MRKKVWIMGMVLLLICSAFCGCGNREEEKGEILSLKEAYDQGCLTEEDLLSIAYYRQGKRKNEEKMGEDYSPKPKTPETLDGKTEEQIVKTIKEKTKEDFIELVGYFGTYNDCIVIAFTDGRGSIALAPTEYFSEIGGVTFIMLTQSTIMIVVFKKS